MNILKTKFFSNPPIDPIALLSDEAYDLLVKRQSTGPVRPRPVRVGDLKVNAAGGLALTAADLQNYDLLVTLTQRMPFGFLGRYQILACPMVDFGGAPRDFKGALQAIIQEALQGTNLLLFCDGGIGRTGTVLAGLIALLESKEETPDPIAAVRQRYCPIAVETYAQAQAIFQLRQQPVPPAHKVLLELEEHFERTIAASSTKK